MPKVYISKVKKMETAMFALHKQHDSALLKIKKLEKEMKDMKEKWECALQLLKLQELLDLNHNNVSESCQRESIYYLC